MLERALGMVGGAQRMVVGHTIQPSGITQACEQRVYRIDVGLSHGCGNGPTQVCFNWEVAFKDATADSLQI